MPRIASHVYTNGDFYPTVRSWCCRLNVGHLDQKANRTLVTEADARRIIDRLIPKLTVKVRRMAWSVGRGGRRKITLDRNTFNAGTMTLGTVLHECAHSLVRRREHAEERYERSSPHGEVFCRTYANLLRREVGMYPDHLSAGQIVRYDGGLWRVEHANPSRAYIVPLNKKTVAIGDATFESSGRGVSIAATSYVEVVENLERARDEMELASVEAELRAARRAQAVEAQAKKDLAAVEAEIAAMKKELGDAPVAPLPLAAKGRGFTWSLTPGKHVFANELKAAVVSYLTKNPEATTKDIQAAMKATPGATAACLDRFWKAGVVVKRTS